MGQCLIQPKLTLKEAGRILRGWKFSKLPTMMLQGVYISYECLLQIQT